MTLSNAIATTGLSATATATGPGVTWRERLGSAAAPVSLPLATKGYECSGTLGGVGNVFTLDTLAASGIVSGTGTAASGTITYGSPANGDTVIVNGTTFTKAATGNGTTTFSTIVQLETLILALPTVNVGQNGTVVTVSAKSVGTAGNAITLAKTGSALTLSAATLTGGVNASTLVGADGKDIEGAVMSNAGTPVALSIQCHAGGVEIAATGVITSLHLGVNGVFQVITPAGSTDFNAEGLTLTSTVADSAFTVTVLGA